MKISIVTPCFNTEKTISDTLESILLQTYHDYEVLIIDGGSKDNTIEVVKRYEQKFNGKLKWVSEKDNGLFDAMNKGIKMATGEIISLLNADDVYAHSNVLSEVNEAFKTFKTDGVYGDLTYVSENDTTKIIRYWRAGKFKRGKLYFGWTAPHLSLFLKKDVYEKFGYFNTEFRIAADYDIMLRFIAVNRISLTYLKDVLVKMRVGGVSNRGVKNLIQKTREDIRATRNNNFGNIFTVVFKNFRKLNQFTIKK